MCYNEIVKRPISVRHAKGDFNFTVVTHMIFAMRFVFLPRRRQFFLRKTGQTWTPEEVPFRLKWSIFKNTKQINNLRTVEREGNSTFTVLFHVKFTYCGNKLISFNTGRHNFRHYGALEIFARPWFRRQTIERNSLYILDRSLSNYKMRSITDFWISIYFIRSGTSYRHRRNNGTIHTSQKRKKHNIL